MSHRENPPQRAGRDGVMLEAANIAAPEVSPLCAECERPMTDILDVFHWDGKAMHRACLKEKARRCLNQVASKRGMA